MESSRSSLPNVDRANSTLFKRYLDEQHKSIVKSNNYQPPSRPINSTIKITHTFHQQQDTFTTTHLNSHNHSNDQQMIVKRKYANGRKPSADASKQRTSHTSRFMKRFQRQYKNGETITNVQKHDGRPRFEFHDPPITKQIRADQDTQCTCLAASSKNPKDHHYHCPLKPPDVPRLSLNELFHSSAQHQRQPIQRAIPPPPRPMLPPPTTNEPMRQESIANVTYPIETNSSIEPLTTINIESEVLLLDNPPINLSNEYWPLLNDLLQELSIEMSDKASVDMLLEIEESLAQRIYDCIVEKDDDNEVDTQSHSTITNDSSALSIPPVSLNHKSSYESNDLPSSPIRTTTKEPIDNREKYFQPIREQPSTSFNNLLDQNRHSTPFNLLSKQIQNDTRSPFAQSLFEPVHLLRTIATSDNDDFNFFPPSFSFDNPSNVNTDLLLFQQAKGDLSTTTSYQHSLPFSNHLLPPRPMPIDTTSISAFKPIDPTHLRSTTSFALKRPQISSSSTGTDWFGQS